jgi:Spy/CpxP family protein refolding chaperone
MNKNWIATMMLAGVSLLSGNKALAQEPPPPAANQVSSDEDLKLFRKDLRSMKKQIIAANMKLTDAEAQQFWPIYDTYTAELVTIMDKKYALLNEYARNYTVMTNQQAESYIKGRAAVEESLMQLRLKYFPIFRKALSGKSTALYFQMDWRLGLIMDLQLASQTPLIEP